MTFDSQADDNSHSYELALREGVTKILENALEIRIARLVEWLTVHCTMPRDMVSKL